MTLYRFRLVRLMRVITFLAVSSNTTFAQEQKLPLVSRSEKGICHYWEHQSGKTSTEVGLNNSLVFYATNSQSCPPFNNGVYFVATPEVSEDELISILKFWSSLCSSQSAWDAALQSGFKGNSSEKAVLGNCGQLTVRFIDKQRSSSNLRRLFAKNESDIFVLGMRAKNGNLFQIHATRNGANFSQVEILSSIN